MREIKFRAWDNVENKMYYDGNLISGDVMVMDISGGLQFSSDDGTWKEKDFILMQYIGLKDKNGKEIYEGDIVNHNGKSHQYPMEILYRDGAFCIGKKNCGHSEWGSWITIRDMMTDALRHGITAEIEVIGDIYTTPELLK